MSTNAYSPETDEDGGDFIVNSSEDEEEEEPRTTLVPSGQVITFEVKTMTGGSMRFSAARATTGKELKAAIEERSAVPSDIQRLIHNSNQIDEDMTLAAGGLDDGGVVHLVVNLPGY